MMKKLLFAVLAFAVLFSTACTKSEDEIQIRFHNTLDQDIQDAEFSYELGVKEMGPIPAGSTSYYFTFSKFQQARGLPMGMLAGKMKGEPIYAHSGLWCGTGLEISELEPDKYTIEISKIDLATTNEYKIKFE